MVVTVEAKNKDRILKTLKRVFIHFKFIHVMNAIKDNTPESSHGTNKSKKSSNSSSSSNNIVNNKNNKQQPTKLYAEVINNCNVCRAAQISH